MTERQRLGGACRELGASDLGPRAAIGGRRPERGSSGEGESGVNLPSMTFVHVPS